MSLGEWVLVTGATGYIATHCIVQAMEGGYRVRGTVRSLTSAKTRCVEEIVAKRFPDRVATDFELVECDLLEEGGWDDAVSGMTYVLHTASPFPAQQPDDEDDLIRPAVAGVENVLGAACGPQGKGIARVVLTSSVAAVSSGLPPPPEGEVPEYDERSWSDVESDSIGAYEKSKTLAERRAWEMVDQRSPSWGLVVLNPGYVIGPTLLDFSTTSAVLPVKLLTRALPALPYISFPCVDVRDVAAAHIQALTAEGAVGERHILVENSYWIRDLAQAMQAEFAQHGYAIPTSTLPYPVLWLVSWFDRTLASIVSRVGKIATYNTRAARSNLNLSFRSSTDAIVDFGYSVIENGIVPKNPTYTGPPHPIQ